jgi:hypothetical protein
MAAAAERDQVVRFVAAGMRAIELMMHLQVRRSSTSLTPPTVTLEDRTV